MKLIYKKNIIFKNVIRGAVLGVHVNVMKWDIIVSY